MRRVSLLSDYMVKTGDLVIGIIATTWAWGSNMSFFSESFVT